MMDAKRVPIFRGLGDGHLLLDPKGALFEFWRAPMMQSDNQFLTNKQQKHNFTFFASHKKNQRQLLTWKFRSPMYFGEWKLGLQIAYS